MLTIAEIDGICEGSGGLLHKAVFPGLYARRTLYISERVKQFITATAPGLDVKMRGRWLTARAVLENFVDGKRMTIKSKPKSKAEIGILCPHKDGIFEFRDVNPKPSVRILGSFTEKDVFIALAPYKRSELGKKGSQGWTIALHNYKAQWAALFKGHQPMSEGRFPDDYVSLARHLD